MAGKAPSRICFLLPGLIPGLATQLSPSLRTLEKTVIAEAPIAKNPLQTQTIVKETKTLATKPYTTAHSSPTEGCAEAPIQ